MKSVGKVVLGVLTILPMAFVAFIMSSDSEWGLSYPLVAIGSLGAIGLLLLLLVLYEIHVASNGRLDRERKLLWGALLFFGGPPLQLVYFVMYVWRRPPADCDPSRA